MPRFQVLAAVAALLAIFPGQAWAQQSLILVPDSGKRRVSAFSALNGAIVNLDFLPSGGNLQAPWKVVQTPWNTLLVSDFGSVARSSTTGEIVYVDDRIQEFTLGGQFIRTLVSGLQVTGGVVKGVGEGFQGVCAVGSTVYFVYSDSPGGVDPPPMPGNQNAVWRVEADGSGLQTVCDAATNPSLGVLRDIAPFQGDFLLSDSSGDDIERLGGNGVVAATPWHDSNGVSNINFPQHVLPLSGAIGPLTDGVCLVAGFSSPRGLYLYDAAGVEVFVFGLGSNGARGVMPMDNGELLFTDGQLVQALDAFGTGGIRGLIVVQGGNFRWPGRVDYPPPCTGDLDASGGVDAGDIGSLLLLFGTAGPAGDLDASGGVDAGDIGSLLLLFGDCP